MAGGGWQKWAHILGTVGAATQDAVASYNGRPANNLQGFMDDEQARRDRAARAQAVQGLMQLPQFRGQLSFGAQNPDAPPDLVPGPTQQAQMPSQSAGLPGVLTGIGGVLAGFGSGDQGGSQGGPAEDYPDPMPMRRMGSPGPAPQAASVIPRPSNMNWPRPAGPALSARISQLAPRRTRY